MSAETVAAQRAELRIGAQAHAIDLLNAVQAVLTGWVLQEDADKIRALLDPLYELTDKD